MQRGGVCYILGNSSCSVLYVGVTSDLVKRMHQHIAGTFAGSFTDRYNCKCLYWYQFFDNIEGAIFREKQIKGGSRKSKFALIDEMNPGRINLFDAETGELIILP